MHPYLTADIPGIGGTIKESPEDFLVEEIPSYLPCGTGEHCYLTIEKRGITTLEAISRIAAALKVPERDIGYAGMKDAVGVTRQTISIQRTTRRRRSALELDGVKSFRQRGTPTNSSSGISGGTAFVSSFAESPALPNSWSRQFWRFWRNAAYRTISATSATARRGIHI